MARNRWFKGLCPSNGNTGREMNRLHDIRQAVLNGSGDGLGA